MSVSKCSLGIYAIHLLVPFVVFNVFSSLEDADAIIYVPVVFLSFFIVSYCVTWVMSKIPVLKNVV